MHMSVMALVIILSTSCFEMKEDLQLVAAIKLASISDDCFEEYCRDQVNRSGSNALIQDFDDIFAMLVPKLQKRISEVYAEILKYESAKILNSCGSYCPIEDFSDSTEKTISEQEKGDLSLRNKWAEIKGCPLNEMSCEMAKQLEETAVNSAADEWINELDRKKNKGKRAKKPQKQQGKKRAKANHVKVKKTEKALRPENTQVSEVSRLPQGPKDLFVQALYTNGTRFGEATRVTKRWQTKDCVVLRNLKDRDRSGQPIQRYLNLTDHEILTQRARHYLPGTERVLSHGLFRTIYSFPEGREGFGMRADLDYGNGVRESGYVYFGIEGSRMYHRYFEPTNGVEMRSGNASDPQASCDSSGSEDDWIPTVNFTFSIGGGGVLSLSFNDEKHTLHIHPIRRELLDRNLL